jgi:hypothetical protein
MSTETKTLDIKGITYTIKRFTADDSYVIGQAKAGFEANVLQVFRGTVSPAFASVEAVKAADHETFLHLFLEISELNKYEPDFLLQLKNSPLQESLQSQTPKS